MELNKKIESLTAEFDMGIITENEYRDKAIDAVMRNKGSFLNMEEFNNEIKDFPEELKDLIN